MTFGLMFQRQTPKPLDADQGGSHDQRDIDHEALEQIEFADPLGYDYMFITDQKVHAVREERGQTLRPWPEMLGVGIAFDPYRTPYFTFTKETFSLSEAVSSCEYTLDVASRARCD